MIEEKLERIAAALELIAKEMTAVIQPPAMPKPADVPAPSTQSTVTPITPPEKPKAKPEAEKKAEPVPAPVVESPWNTTAEMEEYVKNTYNELEQVEQGKGMKIVSIVQGMGLTTVKELKPEHFADFYQKVEALKA